MGPLLSRFRAALETSAIKRKPPSGGSVGRNFQRSYRGPEGDEGDGLRGSGRKLSFRVREYYALLFIVTII